MYNFLMSTVDRCSCIHTEENAEKIIVLAVITNTSPSGKEEVSSFFYLHFARHHTLVGRKHLVTLSAWLSEVHRPF
jgi:hypothetical protein